MIGPPSRADQGRFGEASYTDYHPRWLRPKPSTYWWMQRWSYFAFILRELSSIFVAWFVVYLLLLAIAVNRGAASYEAFVQWSARPIVLALNLITLFFVVFHAVTWFNLAPKAIVVHVAGRALPGWMIAGSNYLAWALVSIVVLWLVVN